MSTYYQRKKEKLERAKEYYENNKKRLQEKRRNKCRELSGKEKSIDREYGRNRYQNMSGIDNQRLKEYQKNYHKAKKISIKKFIFFSLLSTKIEKNLEFRQTIY